MNANEKELSFPSKTENIALVEQLVDSVCSFFRVKEDYYGNILISMTEAVNNAIVHGNKLNPDKQVKVHFTTEGDCLLFSVEDEGPGFDYDNLPDPTAPENIEKPNGRGVFLMKHLADDCKFLDDGRIVSLSFDVLNK